MNSLIPKILKMGRTLSPSFVALLSLLLLNSIVHIPSSEAHVGLTFPQARKYDLDFLDNIRTKPPCGMPKGETKTSIISGSSINITWHLSYPHRGGFRLEMLDALERKVLDLTPVTGDEDFIKGDPTAQGYFVKLPKNFTCEGCTIRLLRQASEWANNYRFWSCADVDIVDVRRYENPCLSHGKYRAGRCFCQKGFYGSRCQYEDECETEVECNNNGKCIHLGGTALPKRQCYCNPGFFGEKCSKRNTVKLPDSEASLDLSRHMKRVLSDRMTLYYKQIPTAKESDREMEFVLVTEGTSWAAVGWRPSSFDKTCKRWPYISGGNTTIDQGSGATTFDVRQSKKIQIEYSPSSHPEPESEPESTSVDAEPSATTGGAAAEPEGVAEPEGEAEAEAEPTTNDPKTSTHKYHGGSKYKNKNKYSEGDQTAEPEAETAATSQDEKYEDGTAEPEAEPESEPEPTTSEPVTTRPKTESKDPRRRNFRNFRPSLRTRSEQSVSDPGSEVNLQTSSILVTRNRPKRSPEHFYDDDAVEGKSEPEPEGEPQAESEPVSSIQRGKKSLAPSDWAPKADFHAMDCIDLVMGGAREELSRIRDYYTRDRSTPRLDTFWGGKEDLTAATGWEKDGKTFLIFRRKIQVSDEADHSLDSGEMHVIWARGQEPGEYVHKPKSGIERETPQNPEFYARDEIKYHGHESQRGITRIDFLYKPSTLAASESGVPQNECESSWSHPPGCSNQDPENPCVYLAQWVYIPGIDSVKFTIETRKTDQWTGIAFSDNPLMRNSDAIIGWVKSTGQFFLMDTFMSSYNAPALDSSQDIGNMTGRYEDGVARLSFVRKVKTGDERDVSLDECRYFLFPTEGGTYNAVNKKIRKHEKTPLSSPEKICIPRSCRPPKLVKPSEIKYQFDIKLLSLGSNWQAPTKGSEDFSSLSNKLEYSISSKLKDIPGFSRVGLHEITKDGEIAVARMHLMVKPGSELADKRRVERALMDTIKDGQAGALRLDPKYLQLSQPTYLGANGQDLNDDEREIVSAFASERLWIVIGCVSALILLALLQAGFTLYKTSGKTSSQKGSNSSGAPWRDYSDHTNYGYDAYDEKQSNAMPLQTSAYQYGNGQSMVSSSSGYGGGHYQQPNYGERERSHRSEREYSSVVPNLPNMSLPRPQSHSNSRNSSHYNGHSGARGGGGGLASNNPADFYFMPSQRKYSGEVVRVYVDHNKR